MMMITLNTILKQRRWTGLAVWLVLLSLLAAGIMAQSNNADGEFCVRAFADTNGNGVRDLNEAPLQGGISANLLDASGIVIASALLDNSPTQARGLICFQFLPPGQYAIEVVSADYNATTVNVMTNVVRAGEVPYVMDFGAHQVGGLTAAAATDDQTLSESQVMRIVVALGGAVGAIVAMSFLGFLIYLIGYRGRLRRVAAPAAGDEYYRRPSSTATSTGGYPAVRDTGEYGQK